jgi:hypothetical protein
MNWLDEQVARERHEDDAKRALREAEIQKLLNSEAKNDKANKNKLRNAVGGKMVEWGERLQDKES